MTKATTLLAVFCGMALIECTSDERNPLEAKHLRPRVSQRRMDSQFTELCAVD